MTHNKPPPRFAFKALWAAIATSLPQARPRHWSPSLHDLRKRSSAPYAERPWPIWQCCRSRTQPYGRVATVYTGFCRKSGLHLVARHYVRVYGISLYGPMTASSLKTFKHVRAHYVLIPQARKAAGCLASPHGGPQADSTGAADESCRVVKVGNVTAWASGKRVAAIIHGLKVLARDIRKNPDLQPPRVFADCRPELDQNPPRGQYADPLLCFRGANIPAATVTRALGGFCDECVT